MKTLKEIRSKLNELYLIRKSIETEGKVVKVIKDVSLRDQLTAINNQIMILQWVLKKEADNGGKN